MYGMYVCMYVLVARVEENGHLRRCGEQQITWDSIPKQRGLGAADGPLPGSYVLYVCMYVCTLCTVCIYYVRVILYEYK